ncbi:MAG: tautomerase family protein [bacterium]
MPVIEVNMLEGRTEQTRDRLAMAISEVVMRELEVPAETVRVLIREVPTGAWYVGGRSKASSEGPLPPQTV